MAEKRPYLLELKKPANNIAALRDQVGVTQEELADKVGAHPVTISNLERGKLPLTLDWKGRIAAALGADISRIVGGVQLPISHQETAEDHRIMALADALSLAARRMDCLITLLGDNDRTEIFNRWVEEARAACQEVQNDRAENPQALPDMQR